MSTPEEILAANAEKAQSTTADGVSVSRRSLSELMEYERHEAAKTATASISDFLNNSRRKLVPPGAS